MKLSKSNLESLWKISPLSSFLLCLCLLLLPLPSLYSSLWWVLFCPPTQRHRPEKNQMRAFSADNWTFYQILPPPRALSAPEQQAATDTWASHSHIAAGQGFYGIIKNTHRHRNLHFIYLLLIKELKLIYCWTIYDLIFHLVGKGCADVMWTYRTKTFISRWFIMNCTGYFIVEFELTIDWDEFHFNGAFANIWYILQCITLIPINWKK